MYKLSIFRSGAKVQGSTAVVIGRSKIVGTPMAELLKWHHATVTTCHSRTANLEQVVSIVFLKIQQKFFLENTSILT